MGEAFIVRRGGAGGLSPSKAVLHIIAEANSTITLEKGGVTVATLGPEKSHVNAEDNTLADWYYAVGAGNYGSWTITAEKSGETGNETVTVNSNKQYDVRVRYADYVIKHGKIVTAKYTPNIKQYDGGGEEITVDGVDYYHLYAQSGNYRTLCYFTPKQNFPLQGGYDEFVISCKVKGYAVDTSKYGISSTTGDYDTEPAWLASANVGVASTYDYSELTKTTLDISGVSGQHYINICTKHTGGTTYEGHMLIRELYFAKSSS